MDGDWWMEKDEEMTYELLPNGKYECELENATVDQTVTPNRLSCTYKIVTGEYRNRKLWQNFNLDEKSKKWLRWQLGILGSWGEARDSVAGSESEFFDLLTEATFKQVGSVYVLMKVTQDTYEGKTRNKALIEELCVPNFANNMDEPPSISNEEELGF